MRILYGVQGTGNGHISRARAMARELAARDLEVQFVFSGRAPDKYFDMDVFGDYLCFRGLTFATRNGSIKYLETLRNVGIREFLNDRKQLNVSDYDLIISDFEPVTSWAAKRAGKFCLGIGHQYAFNHSVPVAGDNFIARTIMRYFAPASVGLGLHWHHFGQQILPPIIADKKISEEAAQKNSNDILVYLPFEDQEKVVLLLQQFGNYHFDLFTNNFPAGKHGNVDVAPQSFTAFQDTLRECNGVICNAGFELSSEALQLGKKLLVKPLSGQMEQASNAAALNQLGLGSSMDTLDTAKVRLWLAEGKSAKVNYPNVPAAISDWLLERDFTRPQDLVRTLWGRHQL